MNSKIRNTIIFIIIVTGLSIYHFCHKDKTDPIERVRERFGPFIVDYFQLDFPNKYNGIDFRAEYFPVYNLTKNENAQVLKILQETINNTTQVHLIYYLDDEGEERREYILDNHEYFLEKITNMLNTQISFRAPPAGFSLDRVNYIDFALYPSGLRLHFTLVDCGLGDINYYGRLSLTIGPETVQQLWFDNHHEIAAFCFAYPVKDNLTCKQLKQRDYSLLSH